MRLNAVRGAAEVKENTSKAILQTTKDLLEALIEENSLKPSNTVSIFFTLTPDLNQAFPAVAARELGFQKVSLMCYQEIPVPDAPQRLVRVLIHYYGNAPRPVYMGSARKLRPDLTLAPEKILTALQELYKEREKLPHRPITTSALARRSLGKRLGEEITPSEMEMFETSIRSLQIQAKVGAIMTPLGHDWMLIGDSKNF